MSGVVLGGQVFSYASLVERAISAAASVKAHLCDADTIIVLCTSKTMRLFCDNTYLCVGV